ncbi:glycosyltransferase family 2 protein [Morganella morganii subsp. morganii]|uniref:glycosyltransferase family 2 protein n=1 Tax=Morganella morganii TaxID=582 RepID=UPI001BD917AB|nr:glycosyltransferase family 2 protein [Morganella morganii]MBT0395902.1 glycosyltransferase family 2 protein [Morganella morganii subsp. morganii]
MKKVSVLVPVYNVAPFVESSLQSILNQTYDNIEIIIVDDASTDNTHDICKKLKEQYDNITIIQNNENRGISESLNTGLRFCTGDYIARADGDDLLDIDRIKKQVEFLENNSAYGVVGCWIYNINEDGKIIGKNEYPIEHSSIEKCIEYSSPILHIWLARRSVYEKLSGYRNTNPTEDYDFILRCLHYKIKLYNLPYYGSYIRLRNGNTLTVNSIRQKITFNYLLKKYKDNEIEELDISNIPKPNIIVSFIHRISTKLLKNAFESKRAKKYLLILLSLVSPYTLQEVYRRKKFKSLVKLLNKK